MVNRLEDRMSWKELFIHIFPKVKSELKKNEYKQFQEWFMEREKVGYLFDPVLVLRCYHIWKELSSGLDHFIVIEGREGTGKSTIAAQVVAWVALDGFTVNNICTTLRDFVSVLDERYKECQDGPPLDIRGLTLDEGNELLSKEAMSTSNKIFLKLFNVQRILRFNVAICIPNFFMLDKTVRTHRTKTLICVKERGDYRAFTGKAIPLIAKWGENEKSWKQVRIPNGTFWDGHFSKDFPKTIDRQEYEFHKLSAIGDLIGETKEDIGAKKMMAVAKIARQLDVSAKTIIRRIVNGELEGKKIGNRWLLSTESYEKLVSTDLTD